MLRVEGVRIEGPETNKLQCRTIVFSWKNWQNP